MSNPVSSQFVLYLEGVQVPFSSIRLRSQINGITTAEITMPYDRRKGLIRRLRAKTLAHVFFVDAGNEMRFMFEGELVSKSYGTSPSGPTCALGFTGTAGNLQYTTFAILPADATAGPAVANGIVNMAGVYLLSGRTVNVTANNVDVPDISYRRSVLLQNFVAKAFEQARDPAGGFNYPKAFAYMLGSYMKAENAGGSLTAGSNALLFLRIAEHRFGLLYGLAGVTSRELSDAFYGQGAVGPTEDGTLDRSEQFLGAVLNDISGNSDVLSVMRAIAGYSYHSLSDVLCPPLLAPTFKPTDAVSASPWKDAPGVLPRLMCFPMMFNADPPVCNLFLSEMTKEIRYEVSCLKPTRFMSTQAVDGASPQQFVASLLPKEIENAVFSSDPKKVPDMAAAITSEEMEVGVIMVDDSNRYPSNVGVAAGLMRKWMDLTGDLRFYDRRQTGQRAGIAMDFNPYPVVGLPGAFVDPTHGVGRGLVVEVGHDITPTSGSTSVAMDSCQFSFDAVDFTGPMKSVEDGYGKTISSFANGTASGYYEPVLGIQSAFKAISAIVKDVASLDAALAEIENITVGADHDSARAAQESFVSRPIASLTDLTKFYATGNVAVTQGDDGLVTLTSDQGGMIRFPAKGAPDSLPFVRPFLTAGISKFVKTSAGATVPLIVTQTGEGLLEDRRAPVVDYLQEINNA